MVGGAADATIENMPSLNFKGKALVQNFHLLVPYYELKPVKSKSLTEKASLHGNLVVHGDNLKALKSLLPYYHGKVKCIYIDPPYNTGNEGWVYNDNVSSPMIQEWLGKVVDREDLTRHDKWLCMMMPRLKILRELLEERGLIGISIDENEFSNLITLCNEVFGESNLFGVTVVRNNPRGRRMGTEFAVEHEYLLLYARNRDLFSAGRLPLTDEQLSEYSEVDFSGRRCRLLGLRKRGALSGRKDRPNLYYSLFADSKSGKVHLDNAKGRTEIVPKLSDGSDGVWRWSKTKVREEGEKLVAREVRRRGSGEKELDIFEFDYSEDDSGELVGRLFPSIWQGSEFNNETGRDQLKELFGGKAVFENPKSVDLIKHLLILAGGDDIVVLDPFAGSGTTAQAVLELNNSMGGKRRFVIIEEQKYADEVTAERVRRVIKGLPDQKANSFSYLELGHPMQLETLLKADKLPSYEDLASYVFYTSTGEDFETEKVNPKTNFIGESKQHDVYLLYEPDLEYLKNTALTLDIARALPKGSGKRRLVFAPTKYLDSIHLDEYRIEFCQLPFEIYKAAKRTA
jgi:adenine-specific DNA-methyltransferase